MNVRHCVILEHLPAFDGIISGTARCVNTKRSLTHSLDLTKEGLVMNASQERKPHSHHPDCTCGFCMGLGRIGRHGDSGTPEHDAWKSMRARCNRPSHEFYSYYGGRGIAVCDRWNDSYENFLADLGRRPGRGYSLERIDNNGNYEPGNVRWATQAEQQRNNRKTRYLTYNGKTQCLTDWAAEIGMSLDGLRGRIDRGWSVEDALTRPRQQGRWTR